MNENSLYENYAKSWTKGQNRDLDGELNIIKKKNGLEKKYWLTLSDYDYCSLLSYPCWSAGEGKNESGQYIQKYKKMGKKKVYDTRWNACEKKL